MALSIDGPELYDVIGEYINNTTSSIKKLTESLDDRLYNLAEQCANMTDYGIGQNKIKAIRSIDGYEYAVMVICEDFKSEIALKFNELLKFKIIEK